MEPKIPIVCIVGPTGSGKSSYAVTLAKERDGEVISVDSRQVYKTLDIGTEKITDKEMQGVPHHLIDIREPEETYSAGDFVQDASRLIENIHARGKLPILAGGTHFYFDALINGLPYSTPIHPEFRKKLDILTNEELYARIKEKDPKRANTIERNNRRRLVRALEIIEQHGHVPERMSHDTYDVTWIPLLPAKDELRTRLAARLTETFARGLIDEVKRVRERVGDVRLNELGLEYRVVGEYLRGEREESTLYSALLSKLYQYARRQEAWIQKLIG